MFLTYTKQHDAVNVNSMSEISNESSSVRPCVCMENVLNNSDPRALHNAGGALLLRRHSSYGFKTKTWGAHSHVLIVCWSQWFHCVFFSKPKSE